MKESLKGLIFCPQGAEDICVQEIQELVPKAICVKEVASVLVEVKDIEDLAAIVYRGQSIFGAMLILMECPIPEHELDILSPEVAPGIQHALMKSELKVYLPKTATFACRALAEEDSQQYAADLGGMIKEVTEATVDLKHPQVQVLGVFKKGKLIVGIDLAGRDLGKREYRVFSGLEYLKATTAYAALRFAGFNKKQIVLDPFCRSALIPIEAALFSSSFSPLFYTKEKVAFAKLQINVDWDAFFTKQDKLKKDEIAATIIAADDQVRHIASAKKNAKIAGVQHLLQFSRADVDWLDTKLEENTVDLMVTFPPEISKSLFENKAIKLYEEFFYQAEYILKKKGTIVIIARSPVHLLAAGANKGFKEIERMHVFQGEEVFTIVKLQKE